jgi:hypothetical protein
VWQVERCKGRKRNRELKEFANLRDYIQEPVLKNSKRKERREMKQESWAIFC